MNASEMTTVPTEEKGKHDREHITLQPDSCVWCSWEVADMESETMGGALMGWTQSKGSV